MPIRQRPVVEVLVYDETTSGPLKYAGHGGRHRVYDLSSRDFDPDLKKNLLINYFVPSHLGQAGSSATPQLGVGGVYEAVKFIGPPVEAAIPYPVIDRNQPVDLNYFDAVGQGASHWRDGDSGSYFTHIDPSCVLMYNGYGLVTGSDDYWSGLRSRFVYPPNPIICLGIVRSDAGELLPLSANPCTNVKFGQNENCVFVLSIPYNAPPVLYVKHLQHTAGKWLSVRPTSGGSSFSLMGDPNYRGGVGYTAKPLWIMAVAGGIAVSEDFFDSVTFFPLRWNEPTDEYPYGEALFVPPGPVEVSHNAGQWGLACLPTQMPEYGLVQGPVEEVPYDIVLPWYETLALPSLSPRQQPARDVDGSIVAVVSAKATLNDSMEPEEYSRLTPAYGIIDRKGYEWRATIPSVLWASQFTKSGISTTFPSVTSSGTFYTRYAPVLFDVIYRQPAVLRTPSYSSSQKIPKAFSVQRGDGDLAASGSLELDNQLGQESGIADSGHPRMVTAMGYWLGDGVGPFPETESLRALFSGWGVPRSSSERKTTLTLDLFDVGKMLSGSGRLSDTFPLDGLLVRDAMAFAAAWCGVSALQCNFEDLGTRLNAGPWDRELYWYTDSGENVSGLMEEMCIYDYNAAMWVGEDGLVYKGCPFCRSLRTAEDYTTHFGTGLASPGCLANDITTSLDGSGIHFRFVTGLTGAADAGLLGGYNEHIMRCEIASIEKPSLEIERDYYNCVRIKGPVYGRDKDSATFDWTDWHSVLGDTAGLVSYGHALGYKKTHERTFGWAVNDRLRRVTGYILWDSMRVKPKAVSLTVPFLPELRRGNVYRVYGQTADDVGISGIDYRVTGYHHDPSSAGRHRGTQLTGRFMRTSVVEV